MSCASQVLLRYLLRCLICELGIWATSEVQRTAHLVLVTSMWPLPCLSNPVDIFSFTSQLFMAPHLSPTALHSGYLLLSSAASTHPSAPPVPCRVCLFQPSATRVLVLANSLASVSGSPLAHWERMRILC